MIKPELDSVGHTGQPKPVPSLRIDTESRLAA